MLALSRKKNEAIVINNNIEITVLEVKGEQVKIGISAPKEVPVYRKEVYVQIQDANKEATNVDGIEINSAKTLLLKKSNIMEKEDILTYLRKKGYMDETIRQIV